MRHEQQRSDSHSGIWAFAGIYAAFCVFILIIYWARPLPQPAPCCNCPDDLAKRVQAVEWLIPKIENCVSAVDDEARDAQADATWCKVKIDEQRQVIECLRMRLDAMEEAKAKAWREYEAEYLAYLKEYEKWRAGQKR